MNFKELHKVYHICPSGNQAKGEDMFESNTTTDIVHLDHYRECTFFVIKLAGAAGTATATIESCDDVSASTSTAIAFTYREVTAPNTHGAWTAATSSGVSISAGADEIWEFNVKANGLNSTMSIWCCNFTICKRTKYSWCLDCCYIKRCFNSRWSR